jgi:hypothetical protein
MTTTRRLIPTLALVLLTSGLGACAALQSAIQPPVFQMASGRSSAVELLGPTLNRPLGGARIRVWAQVSNPNAFGFTLTRLAGNVLLDGQRAADVDLPLGLPLEAAADTVIPLDVSVSFADLPDLADRISDALGRGAIDYALRGTVTVDAGPLGQPSFGPETWLSGDVNVTR